MPLPIAHSAAGVASYLAFRNKSLATPREQLTLILLTVVTANAPDLDFVPGMLLGKPGLFHHGVSHSLFVVTVVAILLFLLSRRYLTQLSQPGLLATLAAAALSHPLFDCLSADNSPPYGVPLLWPLSNQYFMSPVSVFADVVRKDESNATFFATLFNTHNLIGALDELFFSAALIAAILAFRTPAPSLQFRSRLALFFLSTITFIVIRWTLF